MREESGVTLLETICVLAIVALLAALTLPAAPLGTSRTRLEGYALEVAALLKADRSAAIRSHTQIASTLDPNMRTISSGLGNRIVRLPGDVGFDALLPERCGGRPVEATIDFFPSGMSCGGTIALSRAKTVFQVRVNWLTGSVEIVTAAKS